MKRIVSQHRREREAKRNQLIVGVVLVGVMLFSVIGYAFQASPEDEENIPDNVYEYNGLEFYYIDGFWFLGDLSFRYNPGEVQNMVLSVEGLSSSDSYEDVSLYVYSENQESKEEIRNNLRLIASEIKDGCPEGETCSGGIPTISCENEKFIIIRESSSSSIRQEDNCVFIEGRSYELSQLTDRFLFEILGII